MFGQASDTKSIYSSIGSIYSSKGPSIHQRVHLSIKMSNGRSYFFAEPLLLCCCALLLLWLRLTPHLIPNTPYKYLSLTTSYWLAIQPLRLRSASPSTAIHLTESSHRRHVQDACGSGEPGLRHSLRSRLHLQHEQCLRYAPRPTGCRASCRCDDLHLGRIF